MISFEGILRTQLVNNNNVSSLILELPSPLAHGCRCYFLKYQIIILIHCSLNLLWPLKLDTFLLLALPSPLLHYSVASISHTRNSIFVFVSVFISISISNRILLNSFYCPHFHLFAPSETSHSSKGDNEQFSCLGNCLDGASRLFRESVSVVVDDDVDLSRRAVEA